MAVEDSLSAPVLVHYMYTHQSIHDSPHLRELFETHQGRSGLRLKWLVLPEKRQHSFLEPLVARNAYIKFCCILSSKEVTEIILIKTLNKQSTIICSDNHFMTTLDGKEATMSKATVEWKGYQNYPVLNSPCSHKQATNVGMTWTGNLQCSILQAI